jgi:hypothetical protein
MYKLSNTFGGGKNLWGRSHCLKTKKKEKLEVVEGRRKQLKIIVT